MKKGQTRNIMTIIRNIPVPSVYDGWFVYGSRSSFVWLEFDVESNDDRHFMALKSMDCSRTFRADGMIRWRNRVAVSLLPCWLWGLIAAWDRGHMFHESIDFGWGTWAARHWPPWAESAGRSTTRADGLHLHPALSRDKDQPSLKYNLRFFYDFSLSLDFQVYRSSSPLAAGLEPSRLHVYFQLNLKLLCVSRAVPW